MEPRLVITEHQDCQVETQPRWKSPHRASHEAQENMRSRTWISPIPKLHRQPRFPIHLSPHSAEPDSDLKKPSIVFVRAAQSATPALQSPRNEDNTLAELLPAGTRLVARLEAPVSSAVPAPVIAVVEYNYEHNGEIVLPAGARVFGKLSHVTPSGIVGFQFDRVETPDGMVEKIDATAMDLKFGPLKGDVSGRNRGKEFPGSFGDRYRDRGRIYCWRPRHDRIQWPDFRKFIAPRAPGGQHRHGRAGSDKHAGSEPSHRGYRARQHSLLHRGGKREFRSTGRKTRSAAG